MLRGKFIILNSYIWIEEKCQMKNPRKTGQDGRVERPWAHLLSQAHQNHNYLQNNWLMKKMNLSKKMFYNWRHKEGTTTRWVRGAELRYSQGHTPGWVAHKLKNSYIAEVLSKEWEIWAPCLGSPAYGACSRKMSIWLWRPGVLTFKES